MGTSADKIIVKSILLFTNRQSVRLGVILAKSARRATVMVQRPLPWAISADITSERR